VSRRGTSGVPHAVELQIEELVLHGVAAGDRHIVAGAVQQELARLLSERGVPAALMRGGSADFTDGGDIQMGLATRPETIGAQVAHAVYCGVAK
jgi:hypothetical protein